MRYQKIQVTGPLSFKAGAILGLATREYRARQHLVERIEEGVYRAKSEVSFLVGDVFWVDKRFLPRDGVRLIPMPRDYREVDPIEAALAADMIKTLGLPAQAHVRRKVVRV